MRKFLFNGREVITEKDGKQDVRTIEEKQRAFALLEIKAVDEKTRRFKGIATTATPDRMDDVVDPKGAVFKLPIPFLYQHDSRKPIGWVDRAKLVDGNRWEVEGFVEAPQADAPAAIVERLDVAWYELKTGMIRGLSIGFNPKEWSFIKETGGIHWLVWEWLELSMVTIAANAGATITEIRKSFAAKQMAAPGRESADRGTSQTARARAAGNSSTSPKGSTVKTYTQETLAQMQETRRTKAARMAELAEQKGEEGFTDDQRGEFDGLRSEIRNLDDEIAVCEVHVGNIKAAKPVENGHGRAPYAFVKGQDKDDKFKGESYIRTIRARAVAAAAAKDGDYVRPSDFAEQRWGKTNPRLVAVIKANEVAGGGTGSGEWGAELVNVNTQFTGDFIEFLYGLTVFDRLPLRQVPARVRIKGQDGASTGFWVGESKAIKVTDASFSTVDTTPYKVGAITVFSRELLEDSDPSIDLLMRDSLANALAQRVDTTFLSTSAASAGVSPAGILNGLSIGASNGPDAQSARTDYRALLANFITAKNVSGLYWVTSPTLAAGLASMVNALGQVEFTGLTVSGGNYLGYPMVVGDNVGSGDFILLKPSDIWRIGDSGIRVQISDTAMIEQSSAPTGETDTPTAASATLTSMFQEDSIAIKLTRRISYGLRRSTAVAYIGDAAYGAEAS